MSAWLALLVAYTIKVHVLDVPLDMGEYTSEGVVFTPGNHWMILLREKEEIGYIHEARSALDDGWLLEYQMLVRIELVGQTQTVDTTMRAILDKDAYLSAFTASVDSAAGAFEVEGEVREDAIELTVVLGEDETPQKHSIPVTEPVRLSVSALNELIASKDLEVGRDYTQSFFDPLSMSQRELTYTYLGRVALESYDIRYDVHHFRQQVMGNELDVYITDAGELVLQELPLRTRSTKIPNGLGRLRSAEIRRTLREKQQGAREALDAHPDTTLLDGLLPKSDPTPLDLSGAMQRLSERLEGQKHQDYGAPPQTRWRITGVDEAMKLELTSSRQRALTTREDPSVVIVEVGAHGAIAQAPEDLEPLLAATPRINHDAEAIAALLEGIDPAAPAPQRAASVVAAVAKALKTQPNAAIQSAAAALEYGKGDCTEYTLITVAALRRLRLPARFAQGVLLEGGATAAHQWAQYWDASNGQWVDVDALKPEGATTDAHLQLYTSLTPEHPGVLHALSNVKIERVARAPAPEHAQPSP
ncbi:MAG: transglutaminase-like domain-containing protein [Myxococcota bacterium]